eukprot:TRINITY_DN20962_c0_g1_i1.p1 TRINITY_DN20962_c0_g1~~TRINITY_DN20962_c0_g1_i1.p1  ORF type:complete len:222 (-),score=17.89 TRINITY_DN20962_c0_g1_i1:665-1330(-)
MALGLRRWLFAVANNECNIFNYRPRAGPVCSTKYAFLWPYPVVGLHVGVFGSIEPTAEAFLLAAGAARVTTIEYNNLSYEHPSLSQLRVDALGDASAMFDAAVALSAFDHDGLGRYGDPVDPEGDLKAMKTAHRLLVPGGRLYLTVPVGPDVVVWNLHRRYGSLRLPKLLNESNWELDARFGWDAERLEMEASWRQTYEPVHVLRKRDASTRPAATSSHEL